MACFGQRSGPIGGESEASTTVADENMVNTVVLSCVHVFTSYQVPAVRACVQASKRARTIPNRVATQAEQASKPDQAKPHHAGGTPHSTSTHYCRSRHTTRHTTPPHPTHKAMLRPPCKHHLTPPPPLRLLTCGLAQ